MKKLKIQKGKTGQGSMKIKRLDNMFSICKVNDFSQIDLNNEFCFTGRTEEEYSLVCQTCHVPRNTVERDDGWRAFRIEGVLDLSLIGILSQITTLLAVHNIGIFAISTYNTDYILTKEENFKRALDVLAFSGYSVV